MTDPQFEPIPDIWRFHLIYMVVTIAMGWSAFPYVVFSSLFLIAGLCAFGLIVAYFRWFMTAHVLALAIGLGTPVVVFGGLLPSQTIIFFVCLIGGIFLGRRFLF